MNNTRLAAAGNSGLRLVHLVPRPPAGRAAGTVSAQIRRIVYVGDTFEGSTSGMRLDTLWGLGHLVQAVSRSHPKEGRIARLRSRAMWKLGYPRDRGLNQTICNLLLRSQPDLLWCDRPLDIKPATLRMGKRVHPSMRIVAYSGDDMAQSHNQSAFYLRSIPLYDLHVTTKSYNLAELAKLGAKQVLFVNNAFSPQAHFPLELSAESKLRYGGPVGFVGTYERERAEMLVALAKEHIPVRVWGGSWPDRLRRATRYLRIEGRDLMGESYRVALNSFDINLGFLRKINRDLQTTRSVEIPACGGFMLAERTEEHRALFEENVEAAYFSSTEELIGKVKFYLANEMLRRRIARRGFCRAAGTYTYQGQLESVLAHL